MIRNLSYIGFTSPAADQWRTFGPDILGAQLAPQGPDGEIRRGRANPAKHLA